MKKFNRVWIFLLGIILAPILTLCGHQIANLAKNKDAVKYAPTDQLTEYRQKLCYINTEFEDQTQNRIIVKTKRNIVDKKAISVANGFSGLNVLQYASFEDATGALEYYSSLDYVTFCERDFQVFCNDKLENVAPASVRGTNNLSWGADLLGVGSYQQRLLSKYRGLQNLPDVYVAVLDTGIDTDNEFLQGRIAFDLGISYYDSTLYTGQKSTYKFEDDNSHGTHVSGTIVDLTLSNVKIVPIKVLNAKGSGSLSNVVSGIQYVLDLKKSGQNVCAFNMSLGGFGNSKQEEEIINDCFDNNVMPVVAAGNENYFSTFFSPSSVEKALTISALAKNEKYENRLNLAYYSNYGSNVDLCLPGSKILSCVPDECTYDQIYTSQTGGKYAVISGTSMATPHATALVALYATYFGKDFDVKTTEQKLKTSTFDFGVKGKDDAFGFGVPNMELGIDKFVLDKAPKLSYGAVGTSCNFQDTVFVTIDNQNPKRAGYDYKIVYTTDGSCPTTTCGTVYDSPIKITQSTSLKITIFLLDGDKNVCADSECFQADFFLGNGTVNDDGTGFEIDKNGVVTKYLSGLENVVLPQYVNGIKVTKLGDELFCGLGIKSFVCDFDVLIDGYPFCCCDSLEELTLSSFDISTLAKYCPLLKTLNLPNANQIESGKENINLLGYFYGSKTFLGCFALEKISLPNLTEIPDNAFSDFANLTQIDLDFESLTKIGKNAFENCTRLEISANCPQLTELGESAFYNSGLTEFCADKLETVEIKTFYQCCKLQKLILPSATKIKNNAFSSTNRNVRIFLGQRDVVVAKKSFVIGKDNATIYCFDANGLAASTGLRCVDASVTLENNSEEKIDFDLTGYNCVVKTYVSDDDKFDDRDQLVDSRSFDGFNFGSNYTFEKFTNQKKYYFSIVEDQYSNQCQSILNASGQKKAYKTNVQNVCDDVVFDRQATSYYEGETVTLTPLKIKGLKLDSVFVDSVDVTSRFFESYTFSMPCKDVDIKLNFKKIAYSVSLKVVGNGKCEVTDQFENRVSTAYYNQPIFVQYSDDEKYVSQMFYKSGDGKKYSLDINERSTAFSMPDSDVEICVWFKTLDFDDFGILCDRDAKTYEIYSYKGNDTVVNIPQYYVSYNTRYRLAEISSFAFSDNAFVKSVNVVFAGKNTDIKIGSFAFSGCRNLESLNVGNVISVGSFAFDDCAKLQSVDLKNCVEIDKYAFANCKSLLQIDLQSCKTLNKSAFCNCDELSSVTLDKELKVIPEQCFSGCSSLQNIDLQYVETIGKKAFQGCISLSSVDLSSCTLFEKDQDGEAGTFSDCLDLENVKLCKDLKVLPSYAFNGCDRLSNFDFSNIEEIGDRTFSFKTDQKIFLPKLKKIGRFPLQYAKRFVLSDRELLGSEFRLSFFTNYVYIDKNLESFVGEFIKTNLPNRIEIDDYVVYSTYNAKVITFELDDGTVLSQDCYCSLDQINVPKYWQKDGIRQRIAKWKIKGTDTFVFENQIKPTAQNRVYVAVLAPEKFVLKFFYNFDFDHSGTTNDQGDLAFSLQFDYDDKILVPKFGCNCVQKIPFFDIRLKANQNYYISLQMYLDLYLSFVDWDKDLDGQYVSDIFEMFDKNGELCVFAKYAPQNAKIRFSAQKILRTDENKGKIVLIKLFESSQFEQVTSFVDKALLEKQIKTLFPNGAENFVLEKLNTGYQLLKAG